MDAFHSRHPSDHPPGSEEGHQRDRDSRWEPEVSAFLIAPAASSLPPDLKLLARVSWRVGGDSNSCFVRDNMGDTYRSICVGEAINASFNGGLRFYRGLLRAQGFIHLCHENPFLIPVELLSDPPSCGST
jgi:hypothetical protein